MEYRNYKSLKLVEDSLQEPVLLTDFKNFIKVDGNGEDAVLSRILKASRMACENYTNTCFISKTYKITLDDFNLCAKDYDLRLSNYRGGVFTGSKKRLVAGDSVIYLPKYPVSSVTSIITYDNANTGTTYNSSNYQVDVLGARIYLNEGAVWPTNLRDEAGIEVSFVSGFGPNPFDVPQDIKTAIEMYGQMLYECRSCGDMPQACKALLDPYKKYDQEWID